MSTPAPRHNSDRRADRHPGNRRPDRRSRFRDQLPPRIVAVVRDSFPGRSYTGLRADIFELAAGGGNVLILESYGPLTAAGKAALRACARAVAEWRGDGDGNGGGDRNGNGNGEGGGGGKVET